jgi:hypothetical protein
LNYRSSLLPTSIRISGHYKSISDIFRPMWQNDRPKNNRGGKEFLSKHYSWEMAGMLLLLANFFFLFFFFTSESILTLFFGWSANLNYKKISGECLDRKRLDLTWL